MSTAGTESLPGCASVGRQNSRVSISVDPQAIEALRALNPGDDSFLCELIEIYLADSPQRIAEIDHALAGGDTAKMARAAHSLKGSSSNFGAIRLSKLSERLQRLARESSLQEAAAQLPALKEEYARVEKELKALVPPG